MQQRGAEQRRLVFVDVLRVAVIALVIAHHAAQPYGPTGGAWPVKDIAQSPWLGPLYPLGAAFGMGLLMFLAGYFVPGSFDRIWRRVADRRAQRPTPPSPSPPTHAAIAGFVVVLALATWIVRGWYPIDKWVPLFWIVAAEPAHLPQYVSLFALGIAAYRGDWLRRWSARTGAIWLGIGVLASAGLVASLLATEPWNDVVGSRGFIGSSLLYSTWEAVICVGLCVGLIVVCREAFRRAHPLLMAMSRASYAAYILHVLIVIGLQVGIAGLALPALVKFALVTVVGILLAFGAGTRHDGSPGCGSCWAPASSSNPTGHRRSNDSVQRTGSGRRLLSALNWTTSLSCSKNRNSKVWLPRAPSNDSVRVSRLGDVNVQS